MARSLLILMLALTVGAMAATQQKIVPGRSAGPMVLGAEADRVAEKWGAARERPAKQGPDYRWHEYPERGAWMLTYRGRVVKIGVEGPAYATAEGFQVGSSSRSITAKWGPGSRRRAVPWTEGDIVEEDKAEPSIPTERFFLDYPSRGISFLVDTTLDRVMAVHVYYPPRRP